jgi:hypothetical protein
VPGGDEHDDYQRRRCARPLATLTRTSGPVAQSAARLARKGQRSNQIAELAS